MGCQDKESSKALVLQEVPETEELNIFDHIQVALKYRRMILLICIVAVVVTGTMCFLSPEIYSATTSIVPPMEMLQREPGLAAGFLGTGQSAVLRRLMDVTGIADMYVGILKSRAVLDAIIDKFDLMNVYEGARSKTGVRGELQDNTTVKVSDEGIVNITVRDRDPNRAAAMANAYVEELDQRNKRLSSGQATSKRIFLGNRLKEIEERLSRIDNILSREATIQEMLFELLTREYELAKIEEAKSMPTIQVLDEAIVPEERMARGTIRKTAMAGVGSLMFAVFLAFAREYFSKMKPEATERGRLSFMFRRKRNGDGDFGELESKRKIVATQRKKRVQEHKSCAQED